MAEGISGDDPSPYEGSDAGEAGRSGRNWGTIAFITLLVAVTLALLSTYLAPLFRDDGDDEAHHGDATGTWVAQVDSLPLGTPPMDALDRRQVHAEELGAVRQARSADFTTVEPGLILYFVDDGFAGPDEALAYCRAVAATAPDCEARYYSTDPGADPDDPANVRRP